MAVDPNPHLSNMMNTVQTSCGCPVIPSFFDLVDYSPRDFDFSLADSDISSTQDELSLDPPHHDNANTTVPYPYGYLHHSDHYSGSWPQFKCEADNEPPTVCTASTALTQDLKASILPKHPNNTTHILRFDQLTPPSSTSESSLDDANEKEVRDFPISIKLEFQPQPKRPKKELQPQPPSKSSKRKRKATLKTTKAAGGRPTVQRRDSKRRQSLEKNRQAAAKCRVNKKEKQDQLQRSSHEKVVHNALLKDQVFQMKQEVQQMNAILLMHVNHEGCKASHEILQHLNNLGNGLLASHQSPRSGDDSSGGTPLFR